MLEVYERAYRLYVVTYKICQMLQSWDKLLSSTSTSTECHRDFGITVRSSGKWVCTNVKQKCGPLPAVSAVNLDKLNLIEIDLFIKMSLWYGWELRWIELGCVRQPTSQEMKYWKYQKSWESRLFQYSLYACTVCHLYRSTNRSFTNVTRCPLHRNRSKAKNICDKK